MANGTYWATTGRVARSKTHSAFVSARCPTSRQNQPIMQYLICWFPKIFSQLLEVVRGVCPDGFQSWSDRIKLVSFCVYLCRTVDQPVLSTVGSWSKSAIDRNHATSDSSVRLKGNRSFGRFSVSKSNAAAVVGAPLPTPP